MNRTLSLFSVVLLLALASGTSGARGADLKQGFDGSKADLREAGWILPDQSRLVDKENGRGRVLEIEVTDPDDFSNRYAQKYFPVKPGTAYSAEVWIQPRDVQRVDGLANRGAVLFLQYADKDKHPVKGGSFPDGFHGTKEGRVEHIKITRPIPNQARYIQILLGVEGRGTARFDDFQLTRRADMLMDGFKPAEGAEVSNRRPVLNWRSGPDYQKYQVEISPSKSFQEDETIAFYTQSPGLRPPRGLEPGKWYWRVRPQPTDETLGFAAPTRPRTFTVKEDASLWPPAVDPLTEKWHKKRYPLLEARISPYSPRFEVEAEVAGEPARVIGVENGRVRFRPDSSLKYGIHDVTVTVRDGEGRTVAGEGFVNTVRPAGMTRVDPDGILRVNGERFFPLGAFRDPSDTTTSFRGLEEGGFNLTHDYDADAGGIGVEEAEEYLKRAHRHGIKVYLGLGVHRDDYTHDQARKRWIAGMMDQPALIHWYLYDEPALHGVSVRRIRELQRMVESVDPFTDTAIVVNYPRAYSRYAPIADTFYQMTYPLQAGEPLDATEIEEDIKEAQAAVPDDQPVWAALQAHSPRMKEYKRDREATMKKYGRPSRPTYRESRCMAYMALANDVQGLIWYWGPHDWYDIRHDAPKVWRGLTRVVGELNHLQPFLKGDKPPSERAVQAAKPLRVWSREAGGQQIIALINPKPKPLRDRQIKVRGLHRSDLRAVNDTRSIPSGENDMKLDFEPNEVILLRRRIKP